MHPAGLVDSSTGADVIVPSEDDMAPGSPEASLEGTPAEPLLVIAYSSSSTAAASTTTTSSFMDHLPQEAQANCKEVRGMLQGDLLVLGEHQTLYWLLQK